MFNVYPSSDEAMVHKPCLSLETSHLARHKTGQLVTRYSHQKIVPERFFLA